MTRQYTVRFSTCSEPAYARFENDLAAENLADRLASVGIGAEVYDEDASTSDNPVYESDPVSYANGVYLVADTPKTLFPLSTEDGDGDSQLLRECLTKGIAEGSIDRTTIPGVLPETDDAEYRQREDMASGEIKGESYAVTKNIDGRALFVEFDDTRVAFDISSMVVEAYRSVFEEHTSDAILAD